MQSISLPLYWTDGLVDTWAHFSSLLSWGNTACRLCLLFFCWESFKGGAARTVQFQLLQSEFSPVADCYCSQTQHCCTNLALPSRLERAAVVEWAKEWMKLKLHPRHCLSVVCMCVCVCVCVHASLDKSTHRPAAHDTESSCYQGAKFL